MAAVEYHTGARGYPGFTISYTSPTTGNVFREVVPAMALVDSGGNSLPAGSAADPTSTVNTPNAAAGYGINRVATTAVASSLVVKVGAGNLYGYNIVSGASAGYVMIFDSTTAPADGTVTPKMCLAIAANASIQADRDIPIRFSTGIVIVFSTTGPFTKTASATAFLAGDAA